MGNFFKSFTLNKYNSLQIFQFLRFGAFFLISILLAKITYFRYAGGYGTLIISRYELLLLVSGSVTWFWVSSICNTLIPFYQSNNEEQQKHILFNVFVLLTAFSIVGGGVAFIMGYYHPEEKDLFQMFAIVVFLNTPSYLADYIFYLKGKYKSLIVWGSITFILQIVLLCWPIYMRQTLNLAINLWLILSLIKFNYTIILLMKYATVSVHTRLIIDFMKKVMPFMFSILLAGSMDYINSYIVAHYFSKVEFAVFRYASKELPIFLILANTLSNIYSGEIANYYNQNKLDEGLEKLKKSSKKLMRWLFPGTILLLFLSKYFFQLAYNNDLLEGYKIFNIYLLLIISRMLFPQTVIMGMLKNRVFYLISTNYLIINLVLSFWFVNLWGMQGIAYATVISYFIEKIMLVIYCKMEGIDIRKYTPITELTIYTILTLVAFVMSLYVELPPLNFN